MIDRRADVVAALGVVEQVVEQIAAVAIPQMMMRIDDRQRRIDHRLVVLRQPVGLNGYMPTPLLSRLCDVAMFGSPPPSNGY